jgi:GTP diphosphokinase / guanosine-3',5'-bis(diphosphate) 3'-diphosphatase
MNEIEEIYKYYSPEQQKEIEYSYRLAEATLSGKSRENGHPFLEHPVGVAHIVATEIGLGYDAIIAIFLHESIRFYPELLSTIPKGTFSDEIIDIALNLNKIAAIKPKQTKLEAENYKRLIVSYSRDPRVTIIKLADRLEVMRNLSLLPKNSQERKVTETILLYVPIAHQLGFYRLKSELEDIVFKYTEPENYRAITNLLLASERERKALIKTFVEPLKRKLENEHIIFQIKNRTKTAYSIWKKMQKQGVPFEGVHDVFAIRIIIDSPVEREKEHELCWKVYSIVTEEYTPDTSRLRDWITKPKTNGYESLHTTVQDSNGNSVEVQIRTKRMDDIAENGLAAHWSYKGIKEDTSLSVWLHDVRSALESQEKNSYEYVSNFIKDDIFVFTPDGTLRRLRNGASVLDFAFDIHTNLGLRCSGAKIDGKIVSIREKLATGNVVEIMSNKNQKPTADWLNYVVTSKARSKIRQKMKEDELKKAAEGKEIIERRLKNWKLEINDELLNLLCKKYNYKSINDFFGAIGDEKINPTEIKDFINSLDKSQDEPSANEGKIPTDFGRENRKRNPESSFLVIDGKIGDVGYKMAKCCNPIFGDEVFGFVSIKDGIKIHRISCPNAARLIENYPYRIQKVKWKKDISTSSFQAMLKIIIDDSSIFASVLNVINNFNIPIRSSNLIQRDNKAKGEFDAKVQILVTNNQQLDKIISALRKTKGVSTVLRG